MNVESFNSFFFFLTTSDQTERADLTDNTWGTVDSLTNCSRQQMDYSEQIYIYKEPINYAV